MSAAKSMDNHFNKNKKCCPRDHPYLGNNVIHRQGRRYCRNCQWLRNRNLL